jgi:colanic acid biosynthesis glycosyl transferase WcaI
VTQHRGDLSGKRICIIGMHYAPETTGNAPYTTVMARELAAAGAQVHMITGIPHYPGWVVADRKYRRGLAWREHDGAVRLTRVRHAVPRKPTLLGRARMEISFFVLALPVVLLSRSTMIIAVTPMLSALAAAVVGGRGRRLGVLVQDLTGNGAEQSGTTGGRMAGIIRRCEYALLGRARRVGVITPRFAAILEEAGFPSSRLVDLPNFAHIDGVDVSRDEARRLLGWPTAPYLAVHTGNMGMKQGLETVVAAAQRIDDPSIRFVLVGDGNQRRDLEVLAGGTPGLQFVDPVSADEYPLVLAAADVLVLNEKPGVTEMSMPSKLTSYAAAGRPIVAAVEPDSITSAMLTKWDAARLVQAGDAHALLEAIKELQHSSAVGALVDNARRLFKEEFDEAAGRLRYRRFAAEVSQ